MDLWLYGVLGFLAVAWSIGTCIALHRAQREREEMLKKVWVERIQEALKEAGEPRGERGGDA